uniref:Uncharacterized protein n=1 Tax=Rhodopseudomonas palustris (strain BisA53) TaxID=316055 RepID=Q07VI6_RHOP5
MRDFFEPANTHNRRTTQCSGRMVDLSDGRCKGKMDGSRHARQLTNRLCSQRRVPASIRQAAFGLRAAGPSSSTLRGGFDHRLGVPLDRKASPAFRATLLTALA